MPSSKLSSRPKPKPTFRHCYNFEAIGTGWNISIDTELSPDVFSALDSTVQARIADYDRTYSRFRADSLVTTMSQTAATYRLPAHAKPLFDLYARLYAATAGRMTPLIGQLLADAGYDATYSLRSRQLRTVPTWEAAIDYSFPAVRIKQPVLLDFGAAGKGYLVDIVAAICQAAGVRKFSINAGGDIVNYAAPGDLARIGLEHPVELGQIIGIAEIVTGSLCGSASNRRVWNGHHHIMDPRTRQSTDTVLATWVVADSGLLADGLATALFFADATELRQQFRFEYALVRPDLSLEYSRDFPATFFSESGKRL